MVWLKKMYLIFSPASPSLWRFKLISINLNFLFLKVANAKFGSFISISSVEEGSNVKQLKCKTDR
jgi:hypothetical protein